METSDSQNQLKVVIFTLCRFHEQDGWDGIFQMLIKFIYTILPMFRQTAGVRVSIYAQFEKYQ